MQDSSHQQYHDGRNGNTMILLPLGQVKNVDDQKGSKVAVRPTGVFALPETLTSLGVTSATLNDIWTLTIDIDQ